MKLLILFISLFAFSKSTYTQTADEILLKTQGAYRAMKNYVDDGLIINTHLNSPKADSGSYVMAFDKNGNINHRFEKKFPGTTLGASYVKSGSESLGTYTRLGTADPSFSCTMDEAAARTGGSGGPAFFMIGSLFYPDFMRESGSDSSMMLHYDMAKRLEDTTIHGLPCFVIYTKKTITIPQEMADRQNFVRDSTQGLLDLPPEQRGGPEAVAGPKTSGCKYYIRKSDLLIIRQESYSFKNESETISHKSILLMDPMYNVKDFERYMKP